MSDLLGLLGLGARGGNILLGVEAVRGGLQRGKCRCVVVAADASRRALEKVVRLATARGIPRIAGPSAEAIGRQVGRPPVMVVGVIDPALARGIARAGHGSDRVGTLEE